VLPLVGDRTRLAVMSNAARSSGHRVAADVLAQMVLSVVNK
jgi:UDP-N-acetylglucosamine--N-acetylmuramyl-(pentapeptide) pyrophosphoryl-undecaprenol N-acetylglucosamine transferase